MHTRHNIWQRYFSVYTKPQTYKNFLYLFLAFPFGLFYFVFLVTGISVGISLVILWVGILILAGTLAMTWLFAELERILAVELLGANIARAEVVQPAKANLWQRMRTYLRHPFLRRAAAFLALKFPLGIIVFIVWITLLTVSLAFIAAPFTLPWLHINSYWLQVAALPAALVSLALGILMLTGTFHIFNLLAHPLKRIAESILDTSK